VKAVVYPRYGSPDVLELVEIDKPVPAEDEVLVRVRAAAVNPADWYSMVGLPIGRPLSGLRAPKDPRIGVDLAGVIEAVGAAVTDFAPGDEVFGGRSGALAEYVCARKAIALKPANLTFEQAAAVPVAAITALQGLRDHGRLQPGQRVLINGASGGVGTFAVQIAKALGAAHVTGICSTQNVETVRSLGADVVFDYTADDFTLRDERYDLLLDVNGTRSFSEYRRVLEPDARIVIVGAPKGNRVIGPLGHVIKVKLGSVGRSQKVGFFVAKLTREDLVVLSELAESGKVTPVIDRRYPLGEVADAMRYLGEGHARGKIVVTVQSAPQSGD
jgi:NADPH:quinone reductase-like Zn-dependent oxidoreductase